MVAAVIELRQMVAADLPYVRSWLCEPHVVRGWLGDGAAGDEVEKISRRVSGSGEQPIRMLTIVERPAAEPLMARPIGWCQWYPWDAYPAEAEALGAREGDCGLDYAIGDPQAIGRGLGTELIGLLVAQVRRHRPDCGLIVAPEATNRASRRVLERHNFSLIAVRPVASEPNPSPMAIYRAGL
jgi:aminoglycoside 6'-N-acetyltransferase